MKESLGDNDVGTGRMPLSWVRYCRHILTCHIILRFFSHKYTNIQTYKQWVIVLERKKKIHVINWNSSEELIPKITQIFNNSVKCELIA